MDSVAIGLSILVKMSSLGLSVQNRTSNCRLVVYGKCDGAFLAKHWIKCRWTVGGLNSLIKATSMSNALLDYVLFYYFSRCL